VISEFTDDQHVKSAKENDQNKSKQKGRVIMESAMKESDTRDGIVA
jgi:hypothetical protein